MKRFQVSSYIRTIPVTKDRMFENVFDWEHLPHLHPKTFTSIQLKEKTKNSFLGVIGLYPPKLNLSQKISLRGDKKRGIWIVRILDGFQKNLLVHSKAEPLDDESIKVTVKFFLPLKWLWFWPLGFLYKSTYKRVYDEDVWMMEERRDQLAASPVVAETNELYLGEESNFDKTKRTSFQLGKTEYVLLWRNDAWVSFANRCPHMLAPLKDATIEGDTVICPWHGYRFNIDNGSCLDHKLKLSPRAEIIQKGESLFARI